MAIDTSFYGFDNVVERFQSYLESEELWASLANTSSSIAYVKMYAWVMEALSYLLEETVRDLKWGTSSSYQALLEHVKLVGYPARRKVSSDMTVTFSVEESETQNVTIPKGTRIEVLDMYFVTTEQVVLLAGNLNVDADVVQGYWLEYNFSGDGLKDQYYDVSHVGAENVNIEVFVDVDQWTKIDSFYGQSADKICLVRTIYNGVRLEFGDGVFGAIPGNGTAIQVNVLISEGELSNINRDGVDGDVIDAIYAPDASQVDFSIVTKTTAAGGMDAETVKGIKRNVPFFVTSGGVYKRKTEVKNVFDQFEEVSQVHVVAEADKDVVDRDMREANKINIYIVPTPGYTLDYATKMSLLEDLIEAEKLLMNLTFNLEEATYLYIRNVINAYVPNTVSFSGKENVIESRLLEFYNNFIFGDDHLEHLLSRALTEYLDDTGISYIRDTDLENLRTDTYVIEKRGDFEDWWFADGFEGEEDYNDLTEDGIFHSDEDEDDHTVCWIDYKTGTVLSKYAIETFGVEIDNSPVMVDYEADAWGSGTSTSTSVFSASGTFTSTSVQGSVDFLTGELKISVADSVTGEVTIVYKYHDEDIPLLFQEYPILEDYTITVQQEIDL